MEREQVGVVEKEGDLSRRGFLKKAVIGGSGLLALSQLGGIAEACQRGQQKTDDVKVGCKKSASGANVFPLAALTAKDFSHLPGQLKGLSASQLQQHIALYEGYVKKYNRVQQDIQASRKAGDYSKARGFQLRQSYALNGVVLHDLYFSNLTPQSAPPTTGSIVESLINRDFGSLETYFADLRSVGKTMRGWAITGYSTMDGKIHNYGLDTHDQGSPLGVFPLMVLDVYEHAYMVDYGTNRGAYLDAFVGLIDWPVVEQRLKKAMALLN